MDFNLIQPVLVAALALAAARWMIKRDQGKFPLSLQTFDRRIVPTALALTLILGLLSGTTLNVWRPILYLAFLLALLLHRYLGRGSLAIAACFGLLILKELIPHELYASHFWGFYVLYILCILTVSVAVLSALVKAVRKS